MDEAVSEAAAEEARSVALGMLRERGRGAVLVGVARVDAALEALLTSALAPPRGRETLFHTDRPLGSFGAKVALAARLGLIDAPVEQALHSLRHVRNAFAHSTSEVRLADPPTEIACERASPRRAAICSGRRWRRSSSSTWRPGGSQPAGGRSGFGGFRVADHDPGGLSGNRGPNRETPDAIVDDELRARDHAIDSIGSIEQAIALIAGLQHLQAMHQLLLAGLLASAGAGAALEVG